MGFFKAKAIAKSMIYRSQYILRQIKSSPQIPSPEDAAATLKAYSPDPQTSPLRKNVIGKMKYDLTVIVPIYNVEKYVFEAVSSILNQKTKYRFHVIAINDGSPDHSMEQLAPLMDDSKMTVISTENHGLSAARNVGLAEIHSPYLMFVDSDDVLMEDAIECLMDKAYSANADIVQGGYISFLSDTGQVLSEMKYSDSDQMPPNGVLAGMAWGKVYRSHLFEHVIFPEGYLMEDTIITAIITHLSRKICTIPEMVYRYRQHRQSITHTVSTKPNAIHTLYVTQCVLKARKELGFVTDAPFYEHLLRQVVLNYKRTARQPEDIQRCIFALTKQMLMQERPQSYIPQSKKYARLEKAVLGNHYEKYRLLCGIW